MYHKRQLVSALSLSRDLTLELHQLRPSFVNEANVCFCFLKYLLRYYVTTLDVLCYTFSNVFALLVLPLHPRYRQHEVDVKLVLEQHSLKTTLNVVPTNPIRWIKVKNLLKSRRARLTLSWACWCHFAQLFIRRCAIREVVSWSGCAVADTS